MTFPLNEMYGYSRLCDRLRSSAIIWKQVSLRSSTIYDPRSSAIVCDHMETSLKSEFKSTQNVRNCDGSGVIENKITFVGDKLTSSRERISSWIFELGFRVGFFD